MANTKLLKEQIEPKLRAIFVNENQIDLLNNVHEILGTQPDVIGEKENILYLGEITVSGYLGSTKGDFHIGATRKLAESFLKLFILKKQKKKLEKELADKYNFIRNYADIQLYFIYPENARFMKALGYREFIFDSGAIKKYPIHLDNESEALLNDVLNNARNEFKVNK
ncbi:MAG: hypothetical protein IPO06_00110 [Leptospiraceae bacterium]|nr:hypothetical protein [Leptospiraceae bacterium]